MSDIVERLRDWANCQGQPAAAAPLNEAADAIDAERALCDDLAADLEAVERLNLGFGLPSLARWRAQRGSDE